MATWRTHPVSKQEAVMFASRLLAFVLLLVQGALVLAQELTVRFRPEKEEYRLYEETRFSAGGSSLLRGCRLSVWTTVRAGRAYSLAFPMLPSRRESACMGAPCKVAPARVAQGSGISVLGNT